MILLWKRLLAGLFVVRMVRKRRARKHQQGQTETGTATQDKPRG